MTFDEMYEAVQDARRTQQLADEMIGRLAYMCRGRLRSVNVSSSTLSALKRELRQWDMHRGIWKEGS
jgi:mevalonate kinase